MCVNEQRVIGSPDSYSGKAMELRFRNVCTVTGDEVLGIANDLPAAQPR